MRHATPNGAKEPYTPRLHTEATHPGRGAGSRAAGSGERPYTHRGYTHRYTHRCTGWVLVALPEGKKERPPLATAISKNQKVILRGQYDHQHFPAFLIFIVFK